MSEERFAVKLRVEIEKTFKGGGYSGERLTTMDEFTIPARSFTDIAAVLGRFHELGQSIHAEHTARLPMAPGCEDWREQAGAQKCNARECERCHG